MAVFKFNHKLHWLITAGSRCVGYVTHLRESFS